ncbi:uncharacterized protein LOC109811377 [Cajanus cajan]|uniref:Uncharacterized protein ycf33 n=1 Tax=Cajanus cajan TaxID=3821 RepID=A0A151SBJ7_CAJCA|nr:uncharacterized protein LOC109811377 [Cajanus cajan]KYP52148.1 hypothetical protein KK1_026062 [Cajanus cajan]
MRSVSLRAEVGIPSLCLKPKKLVQLSSNAKIAIPLRRRLPLLRLEIGHSRSVIMGALCVGVGILAVVLSEDKAWALGPQGPLVEEFWDNVRRYGLYALTVSTGALYTIFRPIGELLKNPISAIFILAIFGASIYLVSQVLSAMVGVSEFSYDYGY